MCLVKGGSPVSIDMGLRHFISEQWHRKAATIPQFLRFVLETANITLSSFHFSTGLAVHLVAEPQLCRSAPKQPGLIPMNSSQKAVFSLRQHRENSHICHSFQRNKPARDTFSLPRARRKTNYPGCHQWWCCSQGNSGPPHPPRASSRAAPSCYGDSPGGRALSPHKPHHPARLSLGQWCNPLQRPG